VTALTNPQDALELFAREKESIDLVITDHTMPKMTGVQLAEKILQLKEDVPIILMTGYSSSTNEQKAAARGIKGFLLKPVSREELAQTVRSLLDGENLPDRQGENIF
jgi:YesN/AraC family two-component response regulator